VEEMLLAQLMHDKSIFYKLSITEKHFYSGFNQKLFNLIDSAITVEEIDPNYLNLYQLDKSFSIDKLSEIDSKFISTANWKFYETGIKSAYKKRLLIQQLAKAKESLTDDNVDETIETLESGLYDIIKTADNNAHLGNTINRVIDELKERKEAGGGLVGYPTPWEMINKYTLGLQDGLMYVIAARPSQGKTAAALNMMTNLAIENNIPIGFISAESSRKAILYRVLSAIGGIGMAKLKTSTMEKYDFIKFDEATGKIKGSPFYIDDTPSISISELCAVSRKMVMTQGVKVLFIDYLQYINPEMPNATRRDQVTELSMKIKALTRQLNIPVVVLSQTNRMTKEEKIPHLGNLSDSSQVEKDADVVIMIHHKIDDNGDIINTYFLVEKNRDGQTGKVKMHFNKPILTFKEIEK
jgi:replicative DNA helicase